MAFYRYEFNIVEIPIAIQRGVYFSKDRPQYLNYDGALGYVIGHELFHAFESKKDDGGLYLTNWTEASIKEFSHRAQCIINQYHKYSVEEDSENLNWKEFLDEIPSEDIHDIAGIKLAYTAYNSWEKENKMEARLAISPNTNYTSQQMFWISAANLYCTNDVKPLALYVPGRHSSPKYRVNCAFSSMREFSRDFNCPIKSQMYQPKKHPIW